MHIFVFDQFKIAHKPKNIVDIVCFSIKNGRKYIEIRGMWVILGRGN